jgi:transcriptional repressor NrdR
MVVSQDGRRERFDPAVLEEALRSACENRPIAPIQIQSILAHVIAQVTSMGEDELPSRQIAQWVLDELQPLDQVAFIRFASAYLRERAPDESGEHTRTSPS